ncbi:MAG TPA: glycosyl hydrolase [Armatimonadota bacterium]|jgi:hypothetical protein
MTDKPDMWAGFAAPDVSCTQIPFWFLNGEVSGDEWAGQLAEMATHGVHQAMPHPRFGMDRRDYLTDRYWEAFAELVARAAEIGSCLHLYDEYNWSSGPAGGRVTATRENCALGLGMRAQTVSGPAQVEFEEWTEGLWGWGQREDYLAVMLAPRDAAGELDLSGMQQAPVPPADQAVVSVSVPAGEWEVMVFYTLRTLHPSPLRMGNGGLIDYLSPAPTAEFIRVTHDQYAAHFGEHFGSTIQSIFYDESAPYASGPFSWTGDLEEVFRQEHGYDLLPELPLLFYQGGARSEKVRCDYWDTVADLFAERHVGQMADWAERHGIALTGHTFEEPERWLMAGDLFRALRRQQWPGFDSLGGYKGWHFHKPAVGAAHVSGKEVVLCENLGLLGLWECSPRMIREANNQLAVVGVTHHVPHAFFQTIENPKVECPPSFFQHNPYWKYYQQLADLSARQAGMNRPGRHVADIAVLYPVVSWMGDAPGGRGYTYPWNIATRDTEGSRADRLVFEDIVNGLMGAQLDHDVIDFQAVEEGDRTGGCLRVAKEEYRVLVLPPMTTAYRADLARLLEFCKDGGRLLCVGRWPTVSVEVGREDPELTSLVTQLQSLARMAPDAASVPATIAEWIEPDVLVLEGDRSVLDVSHRQSAEGDWYCLSHHADRTGDFRLSLRATGEAALWVAEEARSYRLPASRRGERTEVQVRLGSYEAVYLMLSEEGGAAELPPWRRQDATQIVPVAGPWEMLPVPSELEREWKCAVGPQEVAVPVYRTRELSIQPRDPADVPVWSEWFRPEFDDSGWEQVHCLRGPLLYGDAGSRLFRGAIPAGATAVQLPLPVAGEHVLYLNGERVLVVNEHDDPTPRRLEFAATPGGGGLALECSSMAPDFGLTGPIVFHCEPTPVELGSWTDQGLWWYAGRVLYRRSVEAPAAGGRVCLNLGEVRECAEVWVNGKLAGAPLWPPYRVEITDLLQPGANEVVVVVSNLLANRFAWDEWGTRGPGATLDSGLLGPVTLEVYAD